MLDHVTLNSIFGWMAGIFALALMWIQRPRKDPTPNSNPPQANTSEEPETNWTSEDCFVQFEMEK